MSLFKNFFSFGTDGDGKKPEFFPTKFIQASALFTSKAISYHSEAPHSVPLQG